MGTFLRSNSMPFPRTAPLNKSQTKFHFSFQVRCLENFLSVISMSWSIKAILALTVRAASAARSISVPGSIPVFWPNLRSSQPATSAKIHPLKPMRRMSENFGFSFPPCTSDKNLFLSSSIATISGFRSMIVFSTFWTLSGEMCDVPMILMVAICEL